MRPNKATVLYSSGDLHDEIKKVLKPVPGGRRVVIVAYVGGSATAYLPAPKGMEIICSLQPGATHPNALRALIRRGATVLASNRLHMKVYWSSHRGAVIGSANVSSSALGRSGQKEAGAWFPPGEVDIDRLVRHAAPRKISSKDWEVLDRETDRLAAGARRPGARPPLPSFGDWLEGPHSKPWRLGWWVENVELPEEASQQSRLFYGVRTPHDFMLFLERQISEHEWLLQFHLRNGAPEHIGWLHPDFLVRIPKRSRNHHELEYPIAAVQVRGPEFHPDPPFNARDPAFKRAFKEAVRSRGAARIIADRNLSPDPLMKALKNAWERQKG